MYIKSGYFPISTTRRVNCLHRHLSLCRRLVGCSCLLLHSTWTSSRLLETSYLSPNVQTAIDDVEIVIFIFVQLNMQSAYLAETHNTLILRNKSSTKCQVTKFLDILNRSTYE